MSRSMAIGFWLLGALAFFIFLYLIRAILLPFIVGLGIAYLLDPVADKLEAKGLSRSVATVVITLVFFIGFILLIALLIPILSEQFSGILSALPDMGYRFRAELMPKLRALIRTLPPEQAETAKEAVDGFSASFAAWLGGFAEGALSSGIALLNVLSLLLITPVVTFYLLRDWDRLLAYVDTLLPRRHAETIRAQARLIDDVLAGFLRGQLNVCLLLGAFYAIVLSIIGLKFGILIGLFTGFLCIIPYVGVTVGALIGTVIAYIQFGDWTPTCIVLATFLIGQFVEGNFVTPKLMGSRVGLHPVWIIFGMLAGGALFGLVGVLIAVPVTAVIGVLTRFALEQYRRSPLYGEPLPHSSSRVDLS